MNDKWYRHIIGRELLKLVWLLFTSLFCMLLNLTPIFAILTAIVTIEPTAKASLKRGIKGCQQQLSVRYLLLSLHMSSVINRR